ncbi:MAG: hypothetical protein F6K31_05765 [Symploca sp. SIO2G7]|nr:hypothetical protein [Symploca sp. SIO2G7]
MFVNSNLKIDTEMRRHGDTETRRRGDAETPEIFILLLLQNAARRL